MAHQQHKLSKDGKNSESFVMSYSGLSWTSLFFGWFVPLFRLDILTLALLCTLQYIFHFFDFPVSEHNKILIFGFSYNVFMFFGYNVWHHYLMTKLFKYKVYETTYPE